MRLVDLSQQPAGLSPAAVALGFFDGVHRGHRRVIQRMSELARERGLTPTVFTFRNHPRHVLQPGTGPRLLTSFDERVQLLGDLGVEVVAGGDFTLELAAVSARQFMDEWLVSRLQAHTVVMGPNFRFGHRAEGTVDSLRQRGTLAVEVVQPLEIGGRIVSSTRVRELVAEASLDEAADLLSRPFFVTGVVEPGAQVGRTIGAPTANLLVEPDRQYPPFGVYAVWASRGSDRWAGVANLGVRPTFGEHTAVLEVHLLDRTETLYGQRLRVEFVERLRAEQKFPTVEALREQIQRDVARARARLAEV